MPALGSIPSTNCLRAPSRLCPAILRFRLPGRGPAYCGWRKACGRRSCRRRNHRRRDRERHRAQAAHYHRPTACPRRRDLPGAHRRAPESARRLKAAKLQIPGDFDEEGYVLDATPSSILIVARTGSGVFYGAQTLRQLLLPAAEDPKKRACPRWRFVTGRRCAGAASTMTSAAAPFPRSST